ncbi:MAG: hypothetical protein KAJ16_11145, partial [Calditrichia bacterium]|nr:hypothetical protein [Calditrichia bacterium]
FTEILKLTASAPGGTSEQWCSWRFKQSEFLSFRSPNFSLIFSEGRRKISHSIEFFYLNGDSKLY